MFGIGWQRKSKMIFEEKIGLRLALQYLSYLKSIPKLLNSIGHINLFIAIWIDKSRFQSLLTEGMIFEISTRT